MLLLSPARARAASFKISLDRDTITVGESATLTMTFEGGSIRALPAIPQIPHLEFSSASGHSTQLTIVNGARSSSDAYTFTVTATAPGVYIIPSMTVDMDGFPQHSDPVKLTVLKTISSLPATAANGNNQTAFIRLLLPRTNVYVGEIFRAQMQLFLRDSVVGVQNFDPGDLKAEGFTQQGKPHEEAHTQTQINGAGYSVIPMSMVFTAVKAGKLTLGPATCNMDLFFGPLNIFGQATGGSRHVSVTSDLVEINSQPLPRDHVPAGFSGAVGQYSLSLSASPTNIAIGDPITLTIQISGRGALDSLTLPDQTNWAHFKFYPPTSELQPGDPLSLTGTRTFKLTVVPETMDVHELPPYEFAYFDPEAGAYRTLNQPAIPLIVRPSAASLPPPTLPGATPASDNLPSNQDILHIKPFLGEIRRMPQPLITQPWFLLLQCVPVAAWAALLIRRKREENLAANPRLRRQRQTERTIREGLNELRQAAAANDTAAFFATLFRLLQERLGERLDLPASAITEAVIDDRLRPSGVATTTLDELRELFQACNQARYAPQSTNEELVSLAGRAETILGELKGIKA